MQRMQAHKNKATTKKNRAFSTGAGLLTGD
jgi:hypothetical protein